jgi:hypothetical protein
MVQGPLDHTLTIPPNTSMGSSQGKASKTLYALHAARYLISVIGPLFLVLAWASGPTSYSYAVARNNSIGAHGYCTAEG